MRAIPKDGLLVPNPEVPFSSPARFLPPEGAEVTDSQYWRRREAEGDVTIEREPPPAPARKAKE